MIRIFAKRSFNNQLNLITSRAWKSTVSPAKKAAPKKKRSYKLYLWSFAAGAVLGLNVPLYTILNDYINPLPDLDRELDVKQYQMDLENKLNNLPIVEKLKKDSNYIKIRAWENIDDSSVFNETMTSLTLRQPGGLGVEPMIFINEKDKETITVLHVGKKLVGYPFLVHGGILATILDETLKRCSILEFNKDHRFLKYEDESTYSHIRGKDLTLSYKFPTLADNFIIVKSKCEPVSSDGKVLVKLKIQSTSGRTLVLGEGTFENGLKLRKWFFFW